MKFITKTVFALALLAMAVPAFAENPLQGKDADAMVRILKEAGVFGLSDVTFTNMGAANIKCVAMGYQDDECTFVNDGTSNPVLKLTGQNASELWGLLRKAGLKNSSNSSISAEFIACRIMSTGSTSCSVGPSSN